MEDFSKFGLHVSFHADAYGRLREFGGVHDLANVLAIVKVMPENADTNMQKLQDAISKKLPAKISIKKIEIEEIAFGIKALRLSLMLPDEMGGTDSVEEAIRSVKGVSDVQVEFVSRL